MTVYESDLPGVGRKFELELDDGSHVVVIVHHDGRRELFRRADADADAEKLFDARIDEARDLAAMLQGTGFETVDVSALSAPLDEAIIEWVEVVPESSVAGRTLEETHIRRETGVSIIAVQRGGKTIPNPGSEFEIEVGDVLVALGTRGEQAALESLVG